MEADVEADVERAFANVSGFFARDADEEADGDEIVLCCEWRQMKKSSELDGRMRSTRWRIQQL